MCGSLNLRYAASAGDQPLSVGAYDGRRVAAGAARRSGGDSGNANAGPCRPAFAVPETRAWRDAQVVP